MQAIGSCFFVRCTYLQHPQGSATHAWTPSWLHPTQLFPAPPHRRKPVRTRKGRGGEHLQREHRCLRPRLVPGKSMRKHSEFDDFFPSFINHSFIHSFIIQQAFCILLLCPRCCACFGGIRTNEIIHGSYPHGDYNLVQESGISEIIRLMHTGLPVVP